MKAIAQGKRSDTLGNRVLEQSRPVRAKALNVRFCPSPYSNNSPDFITFLRQYIVHIENQRVT